MKRRTKYLSVKDGTLIPMGNNFAYVLGDHPNKVDDVDIGPNNKNGLSVNHGEIMQFGRTGVRVFSAEPILSGISPSKLVQSGVNPNAVFAAQERYKDIYHLKDDGSHAKLGDWIKGLFGKKEIVVDDTPEYHEDINPAIVIAHRVKKPNKIKYFINNGKQLKSHIENEDYSSDIEQLMLNVFSVLPKKAKERAIELAMRTTHNPTPADALYSYYDFLQNNKSLKNKIIKDNINYILFNKSGGVALNKNDGLYHNSEINLPIRSYDKIDNDIIDAVSKGYKLNESIAKQVNEQNYGIEDSYIKRNFPNRKIQYVETNPPGVNYNQDNIVHRSIGPGAGSFRTSIPGVHIDNGGITVEYGTRNDSTFVRGWDVYDFASPKNDKSGFKQRWSRFKDENGTPNKLIDELNKTIHPLVIRTPWVYEKDADKIFKLGGIYIAPSKRGTFTAAAKQHGMGVQAFASRVLANKSNYSSAMVKKANFARNASRWHHALGGEEIIAPNYATIPLQGNPLYDITGETKYTDYTDEPAVDFSGIKTTNKRPYNKVNAKTAYDYFKDQGANDYQIAALLANAIEESGIEPYALDKTDTYYGISQWDKSRYSADRKSKKDKDYSAEVELQDLNDQLAYYYNSVMNGNTRVDWNHGGKGSGYNTAADARQAFKDAASVDDAVKALVLGYVRPTGGIDSYKNRAKVAEQIYKLISKQ